MIICNVFSVSLHLNMENIQDCLFPKIDSYGALLVYFEIKLITGLKRNIHNGKPLWMRSTSRNSHKRMWITMTFFKSNHYFCGQIFKTRFTDVRFWIFFIPKWWLFIVAMEIITTNSPTSWEWRLFLVLERLLPHTI